jgi:hypothetical protein
MALGLVSAVVWNPSHARGLRDEDSGARLRLDRIRVSGVSRIGVGVRLGYAEGIRARGIFGYGIEIGPRGVPRYALGFSAAVFVDSRGFYRDEDGIARSTGPSYGLRLAAPQTIALGFDRRGEQVRLDDLYAHALVVEPTVSVGRIDAREMTVAYGGGVTYVFHCLLALGVHVERTAAPFPRAFQSSLTLEVDFVRLLRSKRLPHTFRGDCGTLEASLTRGRSADRP